MKRYDDILLNELLNRYERSSLYSGSNTRAVNISVPIDRKLFPEYFDETWSGYHLLHEQLELLEEKGLVSLVWKNGKKGHILKKVVLNTDRLDEIYPLLRRKSRKEKELRVLDISDSIQESLPSFYEWIKKRIEEGKSVRQYVDTDAPDRFMRICTMIREILENKQAVFLRAFSIRLFHDSKIAEKEIGAAARIIAAFHPEKKFRELEAEEILEEYEIYRNPAWIMMKGNGRFMMEREKTETEYISEDGTGNRKEDRAEEKTAGVSDYVRLADFPGGIGITCEDMGRILWDPDHVPSGVLTIENLTSFHQWKAGDELAIYLGGYANQAKRKLLMDLKRTYPHIIFFHFGDIDCGGFRIWKNLCQETGIEIRPVYMDEVTYLEYLADGRPMTDQDLHTMKKMSEDPFFLRQKKLFERMIQEKVKIEQESLQGDREPSPMLATLCQLYT